MKKYLFVAAAAAVTMLAGPLGAAQASSGGDDRATFAVIGDTPYGQNDADHVQFDATVPFLATINADPDVSYASEPEAHYVLVSTRETGSEDGPFELRSYRIVDGVVTEEEISVVGGV